MEEQRTFGYCATGMHMRMLSVVHSHNPTGTAVGTCGSCLRELEADGDHETLWQALVERAKRAVSAAL